MDAANQLCDLCGVLNIYVRYVNSVCVSRARCVSCSGGVPLSKRGRAHHTQFILVISSLILQLSVRLTTRSCSCGQSIPPPPPPSCLLISTLLLTHNCPQWDASSRPTSTAPAGCQICHLWKPSTFTDSICSRMGAVLDGRTGTRTEADAGHFILSVSNQDYTTVQKGFFFFLRN